MQKKKLFKVIRRTIFVVSVFAVAILTYLNVPPIASAQASSLTSDDAKIRYGIPTEKKEQQTKSTSTETVYYSSIVTSQDYINASFPEYYNTNEELYNECAPVAGSIIVGYYDRYYTNLITNYSPGTTNGSNYDYYPMTYQTAYPQGVIDQLYEDMDTNDPDPGTSRGQYQDGLSYYVITQEYEISYIAIASGGVINYNSGTSSLTYQISNGRPISLFLTNYNLCTITDTGSSIVIVKESYEGNHIMIAYGYKRIKYYNSLNVNFRTDLFLKVSTGDGNRLNGWYFVGSSGTTLNNAEAAYIC